MQVSMGPLLLVDAGPVQNVSITAILQQLKGRKIRLTIGIMYTNFVARITLILRLTLRSLR